MARWWRPLRDIISTFAKQLVTQVKTRAVRNSTPPPRRISSGPGFGIRLLPKFNGDYIVQGYICDKIFTKIRSLSPEMINCRKMPYLVLKNPLKIPGYGSRGRGLPKFNHSFLENQFSRFYVMLLTDWQTNRQTNARHYITFSKEVTTKTQPTCLTPIRQCSSSCPYSSALYITLHYVMLYITFSSKFCYCWESTGQQSLRRSRSPISIPIESLYVNSY